LAEVVSISQSLII